MFHQAKLMKMRFADWLFHLESNCSTGEGIQTTTMTESGEGEIQSKATSLSSSLQASESLDASETALPPTDHVHHDRLSRDP